jgi:hypothetical protein
MLNPNILTPANLAILETVRAHFIPGIYYPDSGMAIPVHKEFQPTRGLATRALDGMGYSDKNRIHTLFSQAYEERSKFQGVPEANWLAIAGNSLHKAQGLIEFGRVKLAHVRDNLDLKLMQNVMVDLTLAGEPVLAAQFKEILEQERRKVRQSEWDFYGPLTNTPFQKLLRQMPQYRNERILNEYAPAAEAKAELGIGAAAAAVLAAEAARAAPVVPQQVAAAAPQHQERRAKIRIGDLKLNFKY